MGFKALLSGNAALPAPMPRKWFDKARYSTERKVREADYSFEQRKELRDQESLPIIDVLTRLPDHIANNLHELLPNNVTYLE